MNPSNKNYIVSSAILSNTTISSCSTATVSDNSDNIVDNNNDISDSLKKHSNNNNNPFIDSQIYDSSSNSQLNSALFQQHRSPLQTKFPGFAKQSNVDEKDKLLQATTDILNSKPIQGNTVTGTNMSSFQRFSASCEDAWDSKIEDKILFENEHTNYSNTRQKFGSRYGNIHIIEKATSFDSSNRKVLEDGQTEQRRLRSLATTSLDTCAPQPALASSVFASSVVSSRSGDFSPNDSSDPRLLKLTKLLYNDDCCNMNELRKLTWVGVPWQHRPAAWKLLIGLVPATKTKREGALQKRSLDYRNLVVQYYDSKADNDDIYRQIHIDIPRMQPLLSLFQQPIVQGIFERILYIWSIRHPASGYVQGMNDLVTPFFVTYLSEHVPGHSFADVEAFDVSSLPQNILDSIESDSYWSFGKLLDSIQDNYTFAQPGIQKLVRLLSIVVSRVDKQLHEHLAANTVEYLQFAFRWMNNLLIREIPLRCIIRLWDTYLSEGAINASFVPSSSASINDSSDLMINSTWSSNSGTPFALSFHLFVCAAFLRFWSKSLLSEKDFQGLMLRLQNLPTYHWSEKEVELLLADAYQLKYHFSPNHLKV